MDFSGQYYNIYNDCAHGFRYQNTNCEYQVRSTLQCELPTQKFPFTILSGLITRYRKKIDSWS